MQMYPDRTANIDEKPYEMPRADSALDLREYWAKHRYAIANAQGWACKVGGCCERGCNKRCKHDDVRAMYCETLIRYSYYVERLQQHLCDSISTISLMEIFTALKAIQTEGGNRGPYADSTMLGYLACLGDIYRYAKKHGHANNILAHYRDKVIREEIDKLYTTIASKGKKERKAYAKRVREKIKSLTIWQMEKLISTLCDHILEDGGYIAIALMVYAGLRPAEMRALTWGDITRFIGHPNRFYLNVYKIRDKAGRISEKMKTPNAHRKIPVHWELTTLLEMRRAFVQQRYGGCIDSLPVCCHENYVCEPCKDYQVANFADEIFKIVELRKRDLLWYQMEQILRSEEGGAKEDEKEHLSLYALRRNFWSWLESLTQATDFEKRYIMGHKMLLEGKDHRIEYNDEEILWRILQKMDRCILCERLHRSFVQHRLESNQPLLLQNRGICQIVVPEDILRTGGVIRIRATTVESGDAIALKTVTGKSAINSIDVECASWPESMKSCTGINCEYEAWEAHQHPACPSSQNKSDLKEELKELEGAD